MLDPAERDKGCRFGAEQSWKKEEGKGRRRTALSSTHTRGTAPSLPAPGIEEPSSAARTARASWVECSQRHSPFASRTSDGTPAPAPTLLASSAVSISMGTSCSYTLRRRAVRASTIDACCVERAWLCLARCTARVASPAQGRPHARLRAAQPGLPQAVLLNYAPSKTLYMLTG